MPPTPLPSPPASPPYLPGEEDAIIRVATYCRDDFQTMVISSSPGETDPVRTSVVHPFTTPATADLGTLDCLPLELLSWVCLALDVRSCFFFRHVNRRARQVVSALPAYRTVSSQAMESLRATLWLGIAPFFTIGDLCRPLRSTQCNICSLLRVRDDSKSRNAWKISRSCWSGRGVLDDVDSGAGDARSTTASDAKTSQETITGQFLYLPTMTRCCYNCLFFDLSLGLMTFQSLCKVMPVSEAWLRDFMPVLHRLPMTYFARQWQQQPTPEGSPEPGEVKPEDAVDSGSQTADSPRESSEDKDTPADDCKDTPRDVPRDTQATHETQDTQDTPSAATATRSTTDSMATRPPSPIPSSSFPSPESSSLPLPFDPQVVTFLHVLDAMSAIGMLPDTIADRFNDATNCMQDADLTVWRLNASTFLPLYEPTEANSAPKQTAYLCCYGCQGTHMWAPPGSTNFKDQHNRVFASKTEYLQHFVRCPRAINLWRSSKGGTLDNKSLATWRREQLR